MTKDGDNKELNYPFATSDYRDYFQHTLWSIPGVDAARCLSALLRESRPDNYFRDYEIVNIAGKGDSDNERDNEDNETRNKKETEALAKVLEAINTHEKTITLTCGRCTTGVSVPEWTAVLMLSGSYETKAARYLQTIFRSQTPFKGKTKRECYAFDFAPDRTVTVIDNYLTELSKGSSNPGKKKAEVTETFLKFCSFISIDGSKTVLFDTRNFMKQVNRAYSEQIMQGHYRKLCGDLNDVSDKDFDFLKEIDSKMSNASSGKGKGKSNGKTKVNSQGVTGEGATTSASASDTPPEPKDPKPNKKNKTKGDQIYEILEKIVIRFPMLIYGSIDKMSDSFTIDKFIADIDIASWDEFMPTGLTKDDFIRVAHIIKNERFIAWAQSIYDEVNALEGKPVDERVNGIAQIISQFRYPDKETVLTPWRVVNMHLSDTVGGYDFFGEKHRDEDQLMEPRFVGEDREVTKRVFQSSDPKILELNSKTGLYPLYMAYTLYRLQCKNLQGVGYELTEEQKAKVWKSVIEKQIFVICKTEMAAKITIRTLVGFSKVKVNAKYYTDKSNNDADIIETLKNNPQHFVDDVKNGKEYWKANNNKNMKFNAVVSNPPYQTGVNKEPLYHHFIDIGMLVGDLGTLIHPGRFLFNAGKTPKVWNQKVLNDEHYRVVNYWKKSDEVFDSVDIKGGVAVTMWDKENVIGPIGTFVLHEELHTIQEKVVARGEGSFSQLVYSRDLYQLTETFYAEHPELEGRQSKGHRFDLGTTVFTLFPEVFSDTKPVEEGYAYVVGRENDTRIGKWIKKDYLKLPDNFETYKVVLPKSNGSGHFGEQLSSPFVAEPFHAQNTTFLCVGKFDTAYEAEACLKYVKTKFARCMLGILKVTQDNPKGVWSAVPIQNFTPQSDIDWSLTIQEIDNKLFLKYNLSPEEIDFINKNVISMQ